MKPVNFFVGQDGRGVNSPAIEGDTNAAKAEKDTVSSRVIGWNWYEALVGAFKGYGKSLKRTKPYLSAIGFA
jgi:hypothetical protein